MEGEFKKEGERCVGGGGWGYSSCYGREKGSDFRFALVAPTKLQGVFIKRLQKDTTLKFKLKQKLLDQLENHVLLRITDNLPQILKKS